MPVILPVLTLAAIGFSLRKKYQSLDIRLVMIFSAVLWGVLLVAITETLSLFHLFNRPALIAAWAVSALAAVTWALLKWRKPAFHIPKISGLLQWFQIISIVGIAALTGVIAILAAPNNWDSMTYHLSRVVHWIQNGSVNHYPTSILWQLFHPVYAEYEVAHFQLLSGSDRLAQIPQWLSMLGCVAGVSFITKQLGGTLRSQIFAAFFTATIPMGILQATTTQNDYVVAFWLVCLAALILEARRNSSRALPIMIGASLGLAILTKTTAYLYALPFMLYYGIRDLRRLGYRFLYFVLVISLISLALNLPHFARNMDLFGSPFGPENELSRHQNEAISLKGTLSNVIRNLGLYAGSIEPVNQVLFESVEKLHDWMNLDVNDPRFTVGDHSFTIETPEFHEDRTGSSLHLLVLGLSFVVLLFKRKNLESRDFMVYGFLVLCGFILFCILLRWMPWHTRLHLPLLVLGGAWAGLLPEISKKWVLWAASLALAAMVLPVFYF